jgi:hypothetical protein
VAVAVTLGAVEFGFRFATAELWPAYTGAAIRRSLAPLAEVDDEARADRPEGARARESLHPYLGFVTTPGTRMEEQSYPVTRARLDRQVGPGVEPWWLALRANEWGFVSRHAMPYARRPDDFVVVVLGGSVAMWLALQGEETLREELEERVPGLAGRNVVILNYATNGFKQPQQVMTFAYLLVHGTKPDAVLEVDGFNDAAIAYKNTLDAVAADYPRSDLWPFLVSRLGYSSRVLALLSAQFREKEASEGWAERAVAWSETSNVAAFLLMRRALESQAREQALYLELQAAVREDLPAYRRFVARGPADAPGAEPLDAIVQVWAEGSKQLAALSRALGVPYLHVLQPALPDVVPRPSKPRSAEEQEIAAHEIAAWRAWSEGVAKIYPRMRAEAPALRDAGVAFEDLSYLFDATPATIYYDICHYNQLGNEMLARAIAERLARELAGSTPR